MPKNKRSNTRKSKKSTRRRNVPTLAARLYKTVLPISQKTSMVLSHSEYLSTINGSPEITFSTGNNYYDIASASSWTDFTEQSDSYLFLRLKKVVMSIVRTTDEATMVANMRGGDIYVNYYPQINTTSYTYAALSRDVNSYRIDPMTFDEQKIVIQFPDYAGYRLVGGVDYWLNLNKIIAVTHLQYSTGEIALRTSNTTNNAAVSILFKVKINLHVDFYHRA